MKLGGTVTREGSDVVIRMPHSVVHSLMVAIEVCQCVECKAPRSKATEETRTAFKAVLAKAGARR